MARDDIRSQAIAAAAATVERLGARRRAAGSSPRRRTLRGPPPAAPPARRRGKRVATESERFESLATVRDQRGARSRRVRHPAPRQRLAEDRAHARPHRLRRVRVGAVGPEHHGAADQRVGGANDRADVAGVGDPVQVEAGRAAGLGPALRPDGDRPRPRAERVETSASSSGSTSSPPSPAPAAVSRKRGSAPAARPASTRSSPSVDEQPLALAMLALAQLAHQFQLLVLGAGDHRSRCVCLLVSGFFSWNEKAGREDGPPGKVRVSGLRLGGRTLPG